ncbi:DNA/RNA non-specific endonuclease [Lewinella sp. JB7]|uniref:DNA/RNA non-specific endonuclease n=1 Tax=Lewinella sp. JB7 TaxID=2962887 RepID=UPI0020C9DAB2|nr:DNA/RNA non-specific endonuclease [Lewinella sp. JB7]MCP9236460.1 DNA/RNA non-specific endonuclease [Lewinella sp. JB7]
MAKLRRNHARRGGAAAGGTIVKVGVFAAILGGLVWGFRTWSEGAGTQEPAPVEYSGENYYLPRGTRGEVIDHGGFVLSYNEDWEQAEWVAYVLTRDHLQREWTERRDNFREDPAVGTGSATDADYRGSGYDRGHLAPFADFAWDPELADRTFYLSNVSPQARQFNQGIWRELEELTRDWANRFERLYVITGPVTTEPPKYHIGRDNRVAVPRAYFKVLLDLDQPEQKGIGFIIPNEISFDPLPEFAVSIDEVETRTGIDFFPDLMPEDLEAELESVGNPDFWPFSKKKYDRRVETWNQKKNNDD